MSNPVLSIGALSKLTDCSVPTIRYYEQIGLLPEAARSQSGHRYYLAKDVDRLTFIRRCREFDFSIDQIKELMPLLDEGRDCTELMQFAHDHLLRVRKKLEELHRLENSLVMFVSSCRTECAGGDMQDCVITEELSRSTDKPNDRPTCCGAPIGNGHINLGVKGFYL
ncbi:MAG TPA: helix-turn-helix domain-containing protein [Cellvibrionaceae bacterium]|nr:helix-turn-helix domain-containing protein [Cellvibrionaceae bacterium]